MSTEYKKNVKQVYDMLRILLLSDIHFIHCEDDENDYRSLETAFVEAMDEIRETGGVNQILICGDIANKGQAEEYSSAESFFLPPHPHNDTDIHKAAAMRTYFDNSDFIYCAGKCPVHLLSFIHTEARIPRLL